MRTIEIGLHPNSLSKFGRTSLLLAVFFLWALLGLNNFPAYSQQTDPVLSPTRFFKLVFENHPQVRQGAIEIEIGDSELMKAKGAFDPELTSNYKSKSYEQTDYYDLLYMGLKVPTWYAVDIFAGYENNSGAYVNAERILPESGIMQAGVSIPVLQNLLIDERRTILRQARVTQEASVLEQQKILNDLLLKAGMSYWRWHQAYREYQAYSEAVEIASEILEAVILDYRYGERAGIDTLEALIQFQDWKQTQNEAYLKFIRFGLELENYLWNENGRPLVFDFQLLPDLSEESEKFLNGNLDLPLAAVQGNPQFRLIDFKLTELNIEERWLRERLKPRLNVNLYLLNEPVNAGTFPLQGEQIGFDFSFPLFLRDARGSLNEIRLRTESLSLNQTEQELVLYNQLANLKIESEQLQEMIDIQRRQVSNLKDLLEGERNKFIRGESSIFLINQREVQLVNGRLKLIRFENRRQNNFLEQLHISGLLDQKIREISG